MKARLSVPAVLSVMVIGVPILDLGACSEPTGPAGPSVDGRTSEHDAELADAQPPAPDVLLVDAGVDATPIADASSPDTPPDASAPLDAPPDTPA